MKTVHSPDMVAHLWANRSQDNARNAGQTFYFTGPVLYSYGSHFVIGAHLEDGRVLWNDTSYSISTSRHQSYGRRALSRVQWDSALHVPCLNYDQLRNLQRLRESGDGRTLPELAQHCADTIVSTVEGMAKMREGKGPMIGAFHTARKLEACADELRAYVAKGKRSPAWPLPRLPEELPTGDALRAFIKSIAKGRLMQSHDSTVGLVRAALTNIRETVDQGIPEFNDWRIQNLRGQLDTVGRNLNDAEKAYQAAQGRKSAKVRALWAEHAALSPLALALVTQWEGVQARREMMSIRRSVFALLRTRGQGKALMNYRGRRDTGYLHGKMVAALARLPADEAAAHGPLLARVSRCNEWDISANRLESARSSLQVAQSYLPAHVSDALANFKAARNHVQSPAHDWHPDFARLHAAALVSINAECVGHIERLTAELAAKHARAVDDWKAGTIRSLPFDAGTFARIKGESVETSRGAVVPIAHACRLARIARRVIAAGGKAWPDGAGPRIGAFQVQSIGADGRTVIGCHEFEADEALRMLALLESCEHCARVTVDSEGMEA